jgi:murein DD-endopeptidase MepM/ murein hydrolase activator NlpD
VSNVANKNGLISKNSKKENKVTPARVYEVKSPKKAGETKEASISVLFGEENYTDLNPFFKKNGLLKESKVNNLPGLIKSFFKSRESSVAPVKVLLAGVFAMGAMFQSSPTINFSEAKVPNRTVKKSSKKSIKKIVKKEAGKVASRSRTSLLQNTLNRNGSRSRGPVTHRGLSVSTDESGNIHSGRIILPARGEFSSGFGPRWGKFHKGMDIAGPVGTPINAALPGKISFTGWQSGYGQVVEISHSNGLVTRYAHCSKINVAKGQSVDAGENIANMGMTGHVTGPHVHFEVLVNGTQVNPKNYM